MRMRLIMIMIMIITMITWWLRWWYYEYYDNGDMMMNWWWWFRDDSIDYIASLLWRNNEPFIVLLGASGDVGRHVPRGSIGNLVGVANREISAADGLDVHACLELTSRYLGSIFANIRRRLGRFRVQRLLIKGAFLVTDDRVLNLPLGC